jgi:SAM-dependent methyltransferase
VNPSHDPAPRGVIEHAGLRALSFGAVADVYDRIRPGYPAELFDDLVGYAGPATRRVLEIGAGTGKATVSLADRGLTIHAIEPDPAMAALLRERCAGRPAVTVTVGGFEQQPADTGYDLLVSAQAWHWVDPHVRWFRAASCLRPGGALGLFWNHDHPASPEVRRGLQAAHDRWTPGIVVDDPLPEGDVQDEWPGPHLAKLASFTDLESRRYRWRRVLSGPEYVELLSTMSAYSIRSAEARAGLFDEVLTIVGAEVAVSMDTVLFLARRT